MLTITKRILRDRFVGFVSYTIGGILLVLMYVAILPSVQQSQAQLNDFIKNLPEGLIKAFGMSGDFGSLQGMLALKQYNLVWPLLLIFLVVSLAGAVIAGEIENRSIEIILSSAKSRVEIFFGKYMAGLTYMVVFVVATTLCAIPLAKFYGLAYQTANYYTLMYLSLALGFAVLGLSYLFSSLFSNKSRVFAISGIIYIAMYVLFILTSLKDSLKDLQYLSFFYYYNVNDALLYNKLDHLALVVFVAIGLIASVLALVVFIERDIAV